MLKDLACLLISVLIMSKPCLLESYVSRLFLDDHSSLVLHSTLCLLVLRNMVGAGWSHLACVLTVREDLNMTEE